MGFDLNGLKPRNKKGEYFRNNVWWWRRLADFVLEHVDLPTKEIKCWHSNDGQRVSEKSAVKIARFLVNAVNHQNKYDKWIKESRKKYEKALFTDNDNECAYPFSWANVLSFAKFCENSGGFTIW